ncbi:uncharacterized protein [Watersipora subatra]|uniref:uncharacterized protein n=1 Tax=Watersipora subatra TaxID=2589382 RepID=UPI00355B92E0
MTFLRQAIITASSAAIIFNIQRDWIGLCKTTGESMLPTVDENAVLLVDKRKMAVQKDLRRGDVVMLRSVSNPDELLIKRITAMSGDIMPDSTEPINRYLHYADHIRVPSGHVWVAGDNTGCSRDSRYFGPVPVAVVQGKVLYQLTPEFRDISTTV